MCDVAILKVGIVFIIEKITRNYLPCVFLQTI